MERALVDSGAGRVKFSHLKSRTGFAMSTRALTYYEIVSQLPADATVTFHDVSWDEYEHLLEQVGEAEHLRVSFDDGVLQVMTLSPEHEKYVRFFESLMTA